MTKKTEEEKNHHMGKLTGYELKDGVYHIAPTYTNRFREITEQHEGVANMLKIVTEHASKDLERLAGLKNKIWDEVCDDLGLDRDGKWVYSQNTGTIREKGEKVSD